MKTYLLGLTSKWITLSILVAEILNINISQTTYETKNINQTKNSTATITQINYQTKTTYNQKLPSNKTITKQQGQTGLAYTSNDQTIEIIKQTTDEIIEIGTGDYGEYTGKMTGYGADCNGCTGNLSCPTETGTYNLQTQGQTYIDRQYGQVRILSADLDKFPCGTIITVTSDTLGTFNAIVLDTGSAMQKAYSQGIILMDLAYQTEQDPDIYKATSNNVKYSVQRWGW